MGKLFKTQVFATLDEFLTWLDAEQNRVVIVRVVGNSSLTITYAEATAPTWRSETNYAIQVMRTSYLEIKD